MKRFSRRGSVFLLTVVFLLLSGCYSGRIDQYYSLPQAEEEYLQLQKLIDADIASGYEYAAPTGGSYRQSVELFDVDGDGREEALAFFRDGKDALRIAFYVPGNNDFRKVLTITGEGSSIGRVEFADICGDSLPELMVSWRIGAEMNLLSVYDLTDWSGDLLLNADCAHFIADDMNRSGKNELLIIRSASSGDYLADMYSFTSGREPQATTAKLSAGIAQLQRIRSVKLEGDSPALLAESTLENGDLVSDLLISRDGSLINLTMNRSTGVSVTSRSYSLVYAQDIDGDGITEIPYPQQLYSQDSEVFWSIAWYRYDSSGRAYNVMTTYHSIADSWYFVLPSGWDAGLTVRRDNSVPGESAVTLSHLEGDGSVSDLVTIYTMSGDNRSERAVQDGRFLLQEEGSILYAAEIHNGSLREEAFRGRFHIIYSDWSSGSV